MNSKVIRACPSYCNEKNWFDWVVVDWENEGLLEAQCLLFLDFSTIKVENYNIETSNIEGIDNVHTPLAVGKAALVHSVSYQKDPCFWRDALKKSIAVGHQQNNVIKNRLFKFCRMEDSYQIIDTDSIHCTSFVIPYEYRSNEEVYLEGCASSVIVGSPMSSWHKFFIDYYDTNIKKTAKMREDKDINKLDERYPFEG